MPARKPIGAVISAATVTMISQSKTGSQPASARRPTTIPIPMKKKSAVIHGARSHPGARRRWKPVGGGAGGACWVCSTSSVTGRSDYPGVPSLPCCCERAQRSNSASFITITGARMRACPSPQSSVQMSV